MTTPYMGLTLPVVSTTLGPLWATQLNAVMTLIDSHNHTSGQGQLIPVEAMNPNADMPFGGYSATQLATTTFTDQVSAKDSATVGALYIAGGELFYNDGNGTAIQITLAGGINVTTTNGWGGDYGTDGIAIYTNSSKSFQLTQSTNIAGLLDVGPVLIRKVASWSSVPTGAGQPGVTLAVSSSIVNPYTITLPPAVPASTMLVAMSNTGLVTTPFYPDNSTLQISGSVLKLADSSVTLAKLDPNIAIPKTYVNKPTYTYAVGTPASGTLSATTLSTSILATHGVTIGGVAFTCVNSGATGEQFNKGATNGGTLSNLTDAINAYKPGGTQVYCASTWASGTLTYIRIQVMTNGTAGNSTTLTQTGSTITVSGATFAGGSLYGGGGTNNSVIRIIAGMTFLATATRPTIFTLQASNPGGGLGLRQTYSGGLPSPTPSTTVIWYIDNFISPQGSYTSYLPEYADPGSGAPAADVPLPPPLMIGGLTAGYHNVAVAIITSAVNNVASAGPNCAISAIEF